MLGLGRGGGGTYTTFGYQAADWLKPGPYGDERAIIFLGKGEGLGTIHDTKTLYKYPLTLRIFLMLTDNFLKTAKSLRSHLAGYS